MYEELNTILRNFVIEIYTSDHQAEALWELSELIDLNYMCWQVYLVIFTMKCEVIFNIIINNISMENLDKLKINVLLE